MDCGGRGVATVGETPSLQESLLESGARDEQVSSTVPSLAPPPQQGGLPCPGEHLRLLPLQCNRYAETKKYSSMKEQIKTPEKELSNKEINNLSHAEFKTLIIRMLTKLIELGHKMKEQMKDIQSEIKQNIQGTNNNRKETRTQINNLEQKEEINIQRNRIKKQEFRKMKRS